MKLPREFSATEIEHIILLAWADTIPFETIRAEYGLTENETRKLMHTHQSPKTYARWRTRVEARSRKHAATSPITSERMKLG